MWTLSLALSDKSRGFVSDDHLSYEFEVKISGVINWNMIDDNQSEKQILEILLITSGTYLMSDKIPNIVSFVDILIR